MDPREDAPTKHYPTVEEDLVAATDKPISSNELAMGRLENEIMQLDEELNVLYRTLKPVINSGEAKLAESPRPNPSPQPISPLAQSIEEKADRLQVIRGRVRLLTQSIDL